MIFIFREPTPQTPTCPLSMSLFSICYTSWKVFPLNIICYKCLGLKIIKVQTSFDVYKNHIRVYKKCPCTFQHTLFLRNMNFQNQKEGMHQNFSTIFIKCSSELSKITKCIKNKRKKCHVWQYTALLKQYASLFSIIKKH